MSDRTDQHEEPRAVVNDKRRIDPVSGDARVTGDRSGPFPRSERPGDPAGAAQPIAATLAPSAELEAAQQEAAERLADLQRVTAEYANYRKRVDRDRAAVIATAKSQVLVEMLPVLDDLDRADAHGDLSGAFKTVADKLTGTLRKAGLAQFGAVGDAFDPAHHEAVQFSTSPEVRVQTVTAVLRHGYSLGDKQLRPAIVVVTGPEHETGDGAGSVDQRVDPGVDASVDPGSSGGAGGVTPDGQEQVSSTDDQAPAAGTDPAPPPNAGPGDSGGPGGVTPDGRPVD